LPTFYVYARQSSNDQTSLEAQKDAGRTIHANYPGHTLKTLEEVGSGKDTVNRPVFVTLIESLKAGDVLSVWDSSRLGRDAYEVQVVRREVAKRKATIVEGGRVYEDTAVDRMQSQVIDSFSEFFRSLQREKSLKGIRFRHESGDWRVKDVFGYMHDPKKKAVTINQEQAEIVRRIYQEHSVGTSLNKICKKLNFENVKTTRGGKWSATTVRRILMRPLYTGHYLPEGPGAKKGTFTQANDYKRSLLIRSNFYGPIISIETFEESLKVFLHEDRPHLKKADYRGSKYLFSGFIFCGYCHDEGRRNAYSSYVHQTHHVKNAKTINSNWKLTSLHSTVKHEDQRLIWTLRETVLMSHLLSALQNLLFEKGDEIDHFLLFERQKLEETNKEKNLIQLELRNELQSIEKAILKNINEIELQVDEFIQSQYRQRNEDLARKRRDVLLHLKEIEEAIQNENARNNNLHAIKTNIQQAFFPRWQVPDSEDGDWIFEEPVVRVKREREVLAEFLNGVYVYTDHVLFSFRPKFEYKFMFTQRLGRKLQSEYRTYSRTLENPGWKDEGIWGLLFTN